MNIRIHKPSTAGVRFRLSLLDKDITKNNPEKSLTFGKKCSNGRNNRGVITLRGRGGGHKRKIRILEYNRNDNHLSARVESIEYDPNRSSRIALIHYENGDKRYIICPRFLKVGMEICSGSDVPVKIGNSLPLAFIPLGTFVHNVELTLGKGGQLVRAAGTFARVVSKEGNFVSIQLPSKELRLFNKKCYATIGQVGNIDHENVVLAKAGRNRWLGKRPSVRGVAMNPIDHPHGGGEGRSPIGRSKPVTP